MGEGEASLSGVEGREDIRLGVGSSLATIVRVLIRSACKAGL
jgi:hypothetical protein